MGKMPVSAKYFCGAGIFILRDLSDLADGIFRVSFSEEKGNAPDSRKCDDRVNDAAEQGVLSAEDPGDEVKLEKTDAAPVQSADDRQNERKSVEHNENPSFHIGK